MKDLKERLDQIRDVIREGTLSADDAKSHSWSAAETARLYVEIYAFDKLLHELAVESNKLKARMAYQDVPAAFEREGLKTFTLTEGYRVTLTSFVSASCKDMLTAIAWMQRCTCGHGKDDHGQTGICLEGAGAPGRCLCSKYEAPHAALVKETINAQTLGAFAKAEMEEGRELPDDVFTVNVGMNTSVTAVKK